MNTCSVWYSQLVARQLDQHRRSEILEGTLEYIERHGIAELSLRPLAAELGTSSRMLIHYFGTKDELLIKAIGSLRPDLQTRFADVEDGDAFTETLMTLWGDMTTGGDATSTNVLMQVLGVACSRQEPYLEYAAEAVDVITAALRSTLIRLHHSEAESATRATVLGATFRGLLIDWFVLHDASRTEQALRQAARTAVTHQSRSL